MRTQEDLAEILVRRPETTAGQPPRNLSDLASRLQTQHSLAALMREFPQPCLDLLETLLVFGPCSQRQLAAILHVAPDDATLLACLDVLQQWVAAWELDGEWHVSSSLKAVLSAPLRLGPPVAEALVGRTVEDLRARANALGLGGTAKTKTALIDELEAFYGDGDNIRKLLDQAPSAQREVLTEAAWVGPALRYDGPYLYTGRPDPALSWLLTNGLVFGDWQRIVVPREVAIAIRGSQWHPTLTSAPVVKPKTVSVDEVERDATAAISAALGALTSMLDAIGDEPLAVLRVGGIGVKEVRRLTKAVGGDEAGTRLWLEIAHAAGWLDVDEDVLVPTGRYDDWLAAPPAEQLETVVTTWAELTVVPLIEQRPDGIKAPASLAPDSYGTVAAELRRDVLQTLSHADSGAAYSVDDVTALVAYRRPLICRLLTDPDVAVHPLLREAHLMGLAGRGAISSLGRALLGGSIATVADQFVTPAAGTAIFQADLTIVVAGTPSADLAELLDDVADRESRGAAVTWRCSSGSVRRALDAGRTAEELVSALRNVAVGNALPQPLEYLVFDVARRHGDVRVRDVGSVLRADDPALLAELAAHRSLASLRLAQIAPTVLTSAADAATTLDALRRAGYAPMGEGSDGAPIIERARRRRAPQGLVAQHWVRSTPAPDPGELAQKLLSNPAPSNPPPPVLHLVPEPRNSTLDQLRRAAGHLSAPELRLLASGLDAQHSVWISYTSGDGESTSRVIDPLELAGSVLVAHCHMRDDERHFLLKRINEVRPD